MAKDDKKPITKGRPQTIGAVMRGGSNLDANPERHARLNIDAEPRNSQTWVAHAVKRLKANPDCPKTVTEAARRLQQEMVEAYARKQCAELWTEKSINNMLIAQGYWKRTRPKP